ncbi:MAG: hypothetical protein JWR59_2525 [Brevundimonas sp.]|nr:hypothetical protein [Brevundimonas sp.]
MTEQDSLRTQIERILQPVRDYADILEIDEAEELLIKLIEQHTAQAVQQYHNEITANETKVWILKEDFDKRIALAVREAREETIAELSLSGSKKSVQEKKNIALLLHNKGLSYGKIATVMGYKNKSSVQHLLSDALAQERSE